MNDNESSSSKIQQYSSAAAAVACNLPYLSCSLKQLVKQQRIIRVGFQTELTHTMKKRTHDLKGWLFIITALCVNEFGRGKHKDDVERDLCACRYHEKRVGEKRAVVWEKVYNSDMATNSGSSS